ncbi:MAG TPA: alpha/beta hydrolase [Acidobacteriaceae bacterium]|jgi:pimeloyl-ACP methyl ester carboxylesterase|nr:alpha/beta hydrolase [Acidobacteriaceae bacterium]
MHLVSCGSGDPILFIHGMPTNSRLWGGIIERLRGRYSCFAVDLPGLGRTPRARYGPGYLRRLAEQLDALREENGIEKWHVVGHDAGSAVAVHYAHYFPQHVDHMALLSPSLFPELRPFYLLQPLRKPILGEVLAPFIQAIFWKIAMHRALDGEADSDSIVDDFHAPFSGFTGPWRFMRVMRWGKPEQLLAEVPTFLPELLMPTLIFHGSRDIAIPEAFARRASALLPNAAVVTLDSGHFIPLHQPDSVATSLAGFFEARA